MSKILDYCRLALISPEILVSLALTALALLKPEVMDFFAEFARSKDASMVVPLVSVPIVLLVSSYKIGESLLALATEQGLVKWSNYWQLKNRVYFSWLLSAVDVVSTYVAWYLVHQNHLLLGTTMIVVGWSTCAISIATLAIARVSLRDTVAAQVLSRTNKGEK